MKKILILIGLSAAFVSAGQDANTNAAPTSAQLRQARGEGYRLVLKANLAQLEAAGPDIVPFMDTNAAPQQQLSTARSLWRLKVLQAHTMDQLAVLKTNLVVQGVETNAP